MRLLAPRFCAQSQPYVLGSCSPQRPPEPAVGAKPKKPAKRKSPALEPAEESEFEKWVKTRPWYPLFREARPWYPDEKPSPAKKPKSEK